MYEHPRGGKNNFGDAKNGPPDSYMYFMNQIKVTIGTNTILSKRFSLISDRFVKSLKIFNYIFYPII